MAALASYDIWYRENTYRRNLGETYYDPYRDAFIEQPPRLKEYILWWRDARRAQPNGGSVFNSAITNSLRPEDLRDPVLLNQYFAR